MLGDLLQGGSGFGVVRIVRLVRVFRVVKVSRYITIMKIFSRVCYRTVFTSVRSAVPSFALDYCYRRSPRVRSPC